MYRKKVEKALNLIYSPLCILCKEQTYYPRNLCGDCWSKIEWITKPHCKICSLPFEYEVDDSVICGACLSKKPSFDKMRSVFLYNDISARLISSFKYNDKTYPHNTYSNWMHRAGVDLWNEVDYISFVPLSFRRILSRKYNQSAILAKDLSKIAKKEIIYNLMYRTKYVAPQASLNKKDRLKNVKGVFAMNKKYSKKIKGKTIIIIDDVTTTGATLNECAKILKKNGADKVFVLTMAKTL